MRKNKLIFVAILIVLISVCCISYATEPETNEIVFDSSERNHEMIAIDVPERDINLKIDNLNRDCRVYMYIPIELFRYNMEKFLNNNMNNDFLIEAWESNDLKAFLDKEDFLGYVNYLKRYGFEKEKNEIELRHYSFCLDSVELLDDYVEYNGNKYINFRIFPNEDNEFKIVMKDYLANYDSRNIVFYIDEYGNKAYIDLNNYNFTTKPGHPNVTELNVDYEFQSTVDEEELERATQIAYLIVNIIVVIIIFIIISLLIRRHKKKKEEIEARKFWKKKETKEEKKQRKKEQKELLKEIKGRKRKKK